LSSSTAPVELIQTRVFIELKRDSNLTVKRTKLIQSNYKNGGAWFTAKDAITMLQ